MRSPVPLLVLFAACARIAPPPGGPPDTHAPRLLGTVPDTLASVPDFRGNVEFMFDEVVSEGGQPNFGVGTGDLERLILLSPTHEVPVVHWQRDRIGVHPREGWRPNTVYRVELLAGVRDLRNNMLKASTVVTFTTGAPLPTDTLTGLVVDWSTSRPVRNALVEALFTADSLVYRSQTDSTGHFTFGPLPRGEYLVSGIIDGNRNNRRDPRESFDSLRMAASQLAVGELWAFKHDTTGPKFQSVSRTDSLTATLSFTSALDPRQRLPVDSVRVLHLPDSAEVAVDLFLPQMAYDTVMKARRDSADTTKRKPKEDTTAARKDSVPRFKTDTTKIVGVPRRVTGARKAEVDTNANKPLTTKPALFDRLVVRLKEPWQDSTKYLIEVHGVRTVTGVAGTVRFPLAMPPKKPPPVMSKADSAKARADSAKAKAKADSTQAKADTTKAKPDSTRKPVRP